MLRPKALDHVGLVVADLERTLHFYVEGLGLELLRRRDTSAVLRVGSQEINLFGDSGFAGPDGDTPHRLDHFCLEMDSATIDELVAGLRAAGIAVASAPVARRDGSAVFVRDPDGVRVELQLKGGAT